MLIFFSFSEETFFVALYFHPFCALFSRVCFNRSFFHKLFFCLKNGGRFFVVKPHFLVAGKNKQTSVQLFSTTFIFNLQKNLKHDIHSQCLSSKLISTTRSRLHSLLSRKPTPLLATVLHSASSLLLFLLILLIAQTPLNNLLTRASRTLLPLFPRSKKKKKIY